VDRVTTGVPSGAPVLDEEEPHVNPNTRTLEFSLRDPDGYYVTISAWDGE